MRRSVTSPDTPQTRNCEPLLGERTPTSTLLASGSLPQARMALLSGVDEVLSMKTYSIKTEAGYPFAVEVDAALYGLRNLARTIAEVEGVSDMVVRKPFSHTGDVRATFRYQGEQFAILEPFGDNSRYWIGPAGQTPQRDISPIEARVGTFQPSVLRRLIGSLVTLNFSALTRR